MSHHLITGRLGEELAAQYLLEAGFELLHRNWRSGHLELDLVATHQSVLHIVEVKTRKKGGLTSPEEAMTPAKINTLLRAAQAYLQQYTLDMETQFDLIAIEIDTRGCSALRYLPQVFTPGW